MAAQSVDTLCRLIAARRIPVTSIAGLGLVLASVPGIAAPIAVDAGVVVVDYGDGKCSLVEAIVSATTHAALGTVAGECPAGDGNDTLTLPAGSTFVLDGPFAETQYGLPQVSGIVTIEGQGSTITRASAALFGLFEVKNGSLVLKGVTLSNGQGQKGGAIYVEDNGAEPFASATVIDSTLSGNSAVGGGAIAIYKGILEVQNSTISGNSASPGDGGGIYFNSTETLSIANSTISGNSAFGLGGGIVARYSADVRIDNTTISGNSAVDAAGGLYGGNLITSIHNTVIAANTAPGGNCLAVASSHVGSHNVSDDASCNAYNFTLDSGIALDALANNGGPTQTMAPHAGSSLIDAGDDTVCAGGLIGGVDQRGFARAGAGAHCDIGAVEIGGTPPPDSVPDAFTFNDVVDAQSHAYTYSNVSLFISGINTAAPIRISGDPSAQFSLGSTAFGSADSTIVNGQRLRVRLVSPTAPNDSVSATVDIGGVTDTFTVTAGNDTTPAAFSFIDQNGIDQHAFTYSNYVVVHGINWPSLLQLTGDATALCSINGAAFTSVPGLVNDGDRVRLRVVSSSAIGGVVTATLNIGGISDSFDVTSKSTVDTDPNAFDFADQHANAHTYVFSNAIAVSGINAAASLGVTGPALASVNGAAYTATPPSVHDGDTVRLRTVSSATAAGTVNSTVTIGNVSDSWTVTTN
jgi:hypothetical protein